MDYIIDKSATILALCAMGLAITANCDDPTPMDCLMCSQKRRCAFLNKLIDEIDKESEV